MIAALFEFTRAPGRFDKRMAPVAQSNLALEKAAGLLLCERFERISAPGKYASLRCRRKEQGEGNWRDLRLQRGAQKKCRGRFSGCRRSVARVVRDDIGRECAEAAAEGAALYD